MCYGYGDENDLERKKWKEMMMNSRKTRRKTLYGGVLTETKEAQPF